ASGAGTGGAGFVHPRLGRTAQAMVHDRLSARHGEGLRHLQRGFVVASGRHSGARCKREPQMCNGTSGNLDIELMRFRISPLRGISTRGIADASVDAVITTGGTGFTGRDVTPEAIEPLFEKRMDGFSIAFHMLSHAKIGTSTIQSRATAGVAGATYIFCLPGSPGACRDGWDGILAAQLDYRTRPCNFAEILPRLDE